jgi:hypothetical protein
MEPISDPRGPKDTPPIRGKGVHVRREPALLARKDS